MVPRDSNDVLRMLETPIEVITNWGIHQRSTHLPCAHARKPAAEGPEDQKGLQTHSKRLSHVTGMFLPPGLSSTSLSSRDSAVKFSITMSEKMARVTPAGKGSKVSHSFVFVLTSMPMSNPLKTMCVKR